MKKAVALLVACALICGCVASPRAEQQSTATAGAASPAKDTRNGSRGLGGGVMAMSFGKGRFTASGQPTLFEFSVTVYEDERAEGTFSFAADAEASTGGLAGEVRCVALDHGAARGWIVGTVTRSGPGYPGAPGAGAWFLIVDRNLDGQMPLITPPQFAPTPRAAMQHCADPQWRDDGLVLVDEGALAIFP